MKAADDGGGTAICLVHDGLINPMFRDRSLSLIHISEPTRQAEISYAVFCLKKKKKKNDSK